MKKLFPDTNFFLRIFTRDNEEQFKQAQHIINGCKQGENTLIIVPQILFEIEYVLRKYYKVDRKEIAEHLFKLMTPSYVQIEHRQILQNALVLYKSRSVDLVDCYLWVSASAEKGEIISFDKDFDKLT